MNVSSAAGSVTADDVLLKGTTWTLNTLDPKNACKNYCPNEKDDTQFSQRMTRGVWYDFLIQSKMSDRTDPSTTGYVYVRMKRADERWDTNGDGKFDEHMVYSYTGPVGYAVADPSEVRYLPFINIYRSQHPMPTDSTQHLRDNQHLIDVDEIRVGTDGGGSGSDVIVPGSF